MYGDVWKWAGEFRKTNKNIGIKWTQVTVELKYLIDDAKYWIETRPILDEIALDSNIEVAIHCFSPMVMGDIQG
jgi:fido (protein-threonine AMPylation protein)